MLEVTALGLQALLWARDNAIEIVFLIGLAAAVVAETLWPARVLPGLAARRLVTNGVLGVLSLAAVGFLLPEPGTLAAWLGRAAQPDTMSSPLAWTAMMIGGGVLALDLVHYLVHRLNHAVPLLWRFHAVHHSDREFDISTTFRHHPIEHALNNVIIAGLAALAGLPIAAIALHSALGWALASFQHSNTSLPHRVERWLGACLVTPAMHALHHSAAPEEGHANFGIVFAFWDRWLGTCIEPTSLRLTRLCFGIADAEKAPGESLRDLLTVPLRLRANGARSAPEPIVKSRPG